MSETIKAGSVRFIADQAADTDFFEGPHQRVADAITEAIEHSDAKTIGLIGPWGSGKSTVIKLVEQKLKAAKPIESHLFSFDAWIHQSDPPRRAFLEQLISFLAAREFGDEPMWRKLRNKIRQRKEKTDTRMTPVLTLPGRILLLPVFLLPVAFLFSSRGWYEAWVKKDASGWDAFAFPIALVMVALPIILGIAIYLWFRTTWRFWTRAFWTKQNFVRHRPPYEDESILSLIANRHIVRQQTSAIKAEEPTAIEFQRLFRRVLSPVSNKQERLIIVVDNLDRLDRDEAIKMWTTIRSFFLGAISDKDTLTRSNLPTVILPIDASAISKAQNADVDGDDELSGQSFMDKSFDIIFHVAPPVLTNWQAFLRHKMTEVFGADIDDNWVTQTIRIYRRKADRSATVTPRDIGRAVNAIASAWLVARPLDIPFVSVVYYALYKTEIDANLTMALNAPVVDISFEDPNWRASLAALHYGIEPELARQVFLDAELRSAITHQDPNAFKANRALKGFGTAVERLFDDAGFLNPTNQANFVELMPAAEGAEPWIAFAWRKLGKLFVDGNMWNELEGRSATCAQLLIEHSSSADVGKVVLGIASAMARWSSELFTDKAFISTAVKIITAIAEAMDAHSIRLQMPLPLSADSRGLLQLMAALVDHSDALVLVSAGRDLKALVPELAKQLSDGKADALDAKAEVVLRKARPNSWDVLVNAADTCLTSDQLSVNARSAAALILGRLYKDSQAADNAVNTAGEAGHLQQLLTTAFADEAMEASARAIVLMLLSGTPFSAPGGETWAAIVANQPGLPAMLDRLMREWREDAFFGLLVDQMDHDEASLPIIEPMMSAAIARGEVGDLPVESIVEAPEDWLKHLSASDRAQFLALLASHEDFAAALKAAGTSEVPLRLADELIESEAPAVRRVARKDLIEKLKAVPADEWLIAVRDGSLLFETSCHLNAILGRPMAIGQPLFSSLMSLMPELIANDPRPYAARWFEAAALLAASYRKTLFRNLRDQLLTLSPPPPRLDSLLEVGGERLLADGEFATKSDECVRFLVLPLVTSGGLAWLLSASATVGEWAGNATLDTRLVLRDALREGVVGLDESEQARAALLLNSLKA